MTEYVNDEYNEKELTEVLKRISIHGYIVGGAERLVKEGLAQHDPDGPHHEYLQLTEAGKTRLFFGGKKDERNDGDAWH